VWQGIIDDKKIKYYNITKENKGGYEFLEGISKC
jgi:hypothetical protein